MEHFVKINTKNGNICTKRQENSLEAVEMNNYYYNLIIYNTSVSVACGGLEH